MPPAQAGTPGARREGAPPASCEDERRGEERDGELLAPPLPPRRLGGRATGCQGGRTRGARLAVGHQPAAGGAATAPGECQEEAGGAAGVDAISGMRGMRGGRIAPGAWAAAGCHCRSPVSSPARYLHTPGVATTLLAHTRQHITGTRSTTHYLRTRVGGTRPATPSCGNTLVASETHLRFGERLSWK